MAKQKTNNLTQTVTIKRNETEPEELEILAASIIKISDAFDKLNHCSLTRRAIVILLRDATSNGISIKDINTILDTVPKLKNIYIKPLGKK